MAATLTGAATAVWLGILTSISPCPLATNIAAVSYLGKRVGAVHAVLMTGIAYALGRMAAYVAVGAIVVTGLLSMPAVSLFLQRNMIAIIGPILIITGMFLLELLTVPLPAGGAGERTRRLADRGGILGGAALGMLFALTFCPVSAALFFGSLIPLAVSQGSMVLLPSLYGLGTGLPVLLFAVLLAAGVKSAARMFDRLAVFEKWARYATGLVFIAVGAYLTLRYVFRVW